MRAPPEAEMMMTAQRFAVPYSIVRVMRSPTTEPMVAARKAEIHDGDRDLVAVDHAVTAQDRVGQAGAALIFSQPILVGRHSVKLQGVHRLQIRIALDESFEVEKAFDSLLGRLREVIIATRTDALILRELDFVHDFRAARTFLPEALRHLAFLPALRFERWSFENSHVLGARGGGRMN